MFALRHLLKIMIVAITDRIPLAPSNLSPRLRVKQMLVFEVVFNIDPLVTEPDCSSTDTYIDTLDTMLDGHIVKPIEFKLMLGLSHFIFHIIFSYEVSIYFFPITIIPVWVYIARTIFFIFFLMFGF